MKARSNHEAPASLNADARLRRDLVSGQAMDEVRLIRFVAGPDSSVVPDLSRNLPGRGLWVAADRGSVTQAAKGGFSRAAKAKLSASPDLADLVERLLMRKVLSGLGLARRAGFLISGHEKVRAAVASGQAAWLIEAADGAPDGRRKLLALARKVDGPPRVLGVFASGELDLALGLENVVHLAFLAGRAAERWSVDVQRLSGFRPLLPESWREEP
ncbi:MAG TPA: RNA-binding protein [Caulobacteraceae bacterium]|nr:RNA-binding protein [Caulobacteraceae bacterium]